MTRTRLVALCACLAAGCDDGVLRAFEPTELALSGSGGMAPGPGGGGTSAAGGPGGGVGGSVTGGSGAGGYAVSTPLLIDDFEDGDPHAKEPLGWWYPVNDKTSTQGIGVEPVSRDGSLYAFRTHGSGFQDWGAAIGVDLLVNTMPFNARVDEDLCFAARVGSGAVTPIQVHFVTVDERHYIRELSLSESWARYCVPLRDFVAGEEPLVPSNLSALQFFFAPRERFELWLDDVEIVP